MLKQINIKTIFNMSVSGKLNVKVLFLIFLIYLALFFVLFTAGARAEDYADVNKDGWNFRSIEVEGVKLITAEGPNNAFTVFKFINSPDAGKADIYKQVSDYYNQGSQVSCMAYVAKFRNFNNNDSDFKKDELWENNSSNCNLPPASLQNINNIDIPNIPTDNPEYARLASQVKNINFGDEPIGCPGFKPIIGAPPTTSYNCPNGGSINNGSFSTSSISVAVSPANPDEAVTCFDLGGPFGWLICGLGDLGDNITNTFDTFMYGLLDVPTNTWAQSGVKTAWETFRNLSVSLIALVALVSIASQVFNFDFISTYTIRKILPKLFISTILIMLSWYIGVILIQISNTIGYSIQSLILSPFIDIAKERLGASYSDPFSFSDVLKLFITNTDNSALAATGGISVMIIATSLITGSLLATGGIGILAVIASLIVTASIALIVAFTVIAVRYVLILSLLIISPLALVAWILPNTKKWFDRWWNMIFTLLAMFPIIIAALSFGKAAAIIIAISAGGN
jgi:hypothetical protein